MTSFLLPVIGSTGKGTDEASLPQPRPRRASSSSFRASSGISLRVHVSLRFDAEAPRNGPQANIIGSPRGIDRRLVARAHICVPVPPRRPTGKTRFAVLAQSQRHLEAAICGGGGRSLEETCPGALGGHRHRHPSSFRVRATVSRAIIVDDACVVRPRPVGFPCSRATASSKRTSASCAFFDAKEKRYSRRGTKRAGGRGTPVLSPSDSAGLPHRQLTAVSVAVTQMPKRGKVGGHSAHVALHGRSTPRAAMLNRSRAPTGRDRGTSRDDPATVRKSRAAVARPFRARIRASRRSRLRDQTCAKFQRLGSNASTRPGHDPAAY